MSRKMDWNALAELQFLLYSRIAGALNEALSSIALSDMPEAQDKPPGYWKERAMNKISNVLNLFTAWSYLIRFKRGDPIPERAIRPFRANTLLHWLGVQLQLNPIPQLKNNSLLHANKETLQEALLLLYSVAYTQGSGVHVEVENSALGAWFRVRFSRMKPLPNTLEALLESFGEHWREQDTAFELTTARDFVRLNGSELKLIASGLQGEFVFFVKSVGTATEKDALKPVQVEEPALDADLSPAKPQTLRPAPADGETLDLRDRGRPTPVLDVQAGKLMSGAQEPPQPTLDILRPLPPTLSELERRAALREDAQAGAEQRAGGPESHAETGVPHQTAPNGSVIKPVKLPKPELPAHLKTPPAATSNVALTKETQTLTPVKAASKPEKTTREDDKISAADTPTHVPPASTDAAPASPSTHKDHS